MLGDTVVKHAENYLLTETKVSHHDLIWLNMIYAYNTNVHASLEFSISVFTETKVKGAGCYKITIQPLSLSEMAGLRVY